MVIRCVIAVEMDKTQKKINKMFNHDDGCLASLGAMKPADYYQYAQAKIQSIGVIEKGFKKLGIEPEEVNEIPPVYVWGFPKDEKSRWVYNLNGCTLSYEVEGTCMYFSDSRIYLYSYRYDTINGTHKEVAEEFDYKDVVSVATFEETENRQIGKKKTMTVTYNLLKIVVPGDKMYFGFINNSETDRLIKAAKQKIKEKKE